VIDNVFSNITIKQTMAANLFWECTMLDEVYALLQKGHTTEWNRFRTICHVDALKGESGQVTHKRSEQIIMEMIPHLNSFDLNKTYYEIGNIIIPNGSTLVEYACVYDSVKLLELLISLGANFCLKKALESVRLCIGKTKVLTYLIKRYDADPNHLINSESFLCQYLRYNNCNKETIMMLATEITIQFGDNLAKVTKYVDNIDDIRSLSKSLKISFFPSIARLFEAITINFSCVEEIPESINLLQNLQSLSLTDGRIDSIPNSIGDLVNLKSLSLDNNKIRKIPKTIGNLINLQAFTICRNPITKLPKSIKRLTNLQTFKFDSYKIKNMDRTIRRCKDIAEATRIDNFPLEMYMKKRFNTEPVSDPYTLPKLTDAYGKTYDMYGELAIALCEVSSEPLPQMYRMFIKPSAIRCLINQEEINKYFGCGIYIEIPLHKEDMQRIKCHILVIEEKGLRVKFLDLYVD